MKYSVEKIVSYFDFKEETFKKSVPVEHAEYISFELFKGPLRAELRHSLTLRQRIDFCRINITYEFIFEKSVEELSRENGLKVMMIAMEMTRKEMSKIFITRGLPDLVPSMMSEDVVEQEFGQSLDVLKH